MVQNFVSGKRDVVQERSFVTVLDMLVGVQVELTSAAKTQLSTDDGKTIGVLNADPANMALYDSGTVPAGVLNNVALFGTTFQGYSGGTFDIGDWLEVSSGKLIAKATVTEMIALKSSAAADTLVEYLKK